MVVFKTHNLIKYYDVHMPRQILKTFEHDLLKYIELVLILKQVVKNLKIYQFLVRFYKLDHTFAYMEFSEEE